MELRKFTQTQVDLAKKMRLEGRSLPHIESVCGIPKGSLKRLFKQMGVVISEEQRKKNIVGSRWKNHNPIESGTKKCSRCKSNLPLNDFNKQSSSKTGLSDACRKCLSLGYEKNKDKIIKLVKKYREKNKDQISEKSKIYYQKNKEKIINRTNYWSANNQSRRKSIEKKYRDNNRSLRNAALAEYRANKQKATPLWLTQDQKNEIKNFYKNVPVGHQVDHIVPLSSDIVCGFHVPWNMQYLKSEQNEAKSNYHFDNGAVGECFQKAKKNETESEDRDLGLPFNSSIGDFILGQETMSDEHEKFISRYEWLGNTGRRGKLHVFVARHKTTGILGGVVIIGIPTMYMAGDRSQQALVQRGATASWTPTNLGSKLVMFACRTMVKNTATRVFVGYSDPEAGEIGTIYQACNFLYLGNRFGAKTVYEIQEGKWCSAREFTNTRAMKRWAKELGIVWQSEWTKPNGFQKLSAMPKEIIMKLKAHAKEKILSLPARLATPKGKYALVLGKDRREGRLLDKEIKKQLITFPYPKRKQQKVD